MDSTTPQWRIQDFPKVGREPSGEEDVNTQFCQIEPKTAWNWKNLDARRGGGGGVGGGGIDPPMPYNHPFLAFITSCYMLK